MAKKAEKKQRGETTVPKLAKFLAGYSNASSRAGYKTAIESFLRCIYGIKSEDIKSGKIPAPDYNALFEMYLISKRDNDADFIRFSEHLIETRPALSAKQAMTLTRYAMTYHGISISKGTSQDIRRETMKGSAATVDRVLNTRIINAALQHCTIQGKALFLCLGSNGARLNEMLSVSINDVDFNSHPVKMTFRGENTKNGQQRYTFISDEAAAATAAWLKVRPQYITMCNAKSKKLIERGLASVKSAGDTRLFPFSDASVTAWWNDALAASGELTKDDVTGRNQLRIHGFRKFFLSQMSLVISKEIPEFLAGHASYLSGSYRRYDEETVAAAYLEAMHMVSITGSKQVKELENELKEKMAEQSAKTEKHADTLVMVINENMNLKNQMTVIQEQNVALQERLQLIEQTSEEQRAAMDKLNRLALNLTPQQLAAIAEIVAQNRGTAD
ncbi:MAG: site-specific integrase [Methanoregula sp.]|jgi:integrase|uniref:site-specific integrase n=1 Tax=Methanoregula sp. TaxID=2052170 RepID=UPI003D108576